MCSARSPLRSSSGTMRRTAIRWWNSDATGAWNSSTRSTIASTSRSELVDDRVSVLHLERRLAVAGQEGVGGGGQALGHHREESRHLAVDVVEVVVERLADRALHVGHGADGIQTPAQAQRTSLISSAGSTSRAHVGHHHRASTGVPQAAWWRGTVSSPALVAAPADGACSAPHWARSRSAPARAAPSSVKPVRQAHGAARVRGGDDEALLLEVAQPLGEDVRGEGRQRRLQLTEAARPVEQHGDEQERPPVPDAGDRGVEGREVVAGHVRSFAAGCVVTPDATVLQSLATDK